MQSGDGLETRSRWREFRLVFGEVINAIEHRLGLCEAIRDWGEIRSRLAESHRIRGAKRKGIDGFAHERKVSLAPLGRPPSSGVTGAGATMGGVGSFRELDPPRQAILSL
jgi:hypothetical protein